LVIMLPQLMLNPHGVDLDILAVHEKKFLRQVDELASWLVWTRQTP